MTNQYTSSTARLQRHSLVKSAEASRRGVLPFLHNSKTVFGTLDFFSDSGAKKKV